MSHSRESVPGLSIVQFGVSHQDTGLRYVRLFHGDVTPFMADRTEVTEYSAKLHYARLEMNDFYPPGSEECSDTRPGVEVSTHPRDFNVGLNNLNVAFAELLKNEPGLEFVVLVITFSTAKKKNRQIFVYFERA